MSTQANGTGIIAAWWDGIARQARDRDVRRQLRYNRGRKAVVGAWLASGVRERVPPLLAEYLQKLLGAVAAFWLIAALLSLFHAPALYTFAAFGLLYSAQASYHTFRLSRDPGYRIRKCNCAGAGGDASEAVLRSRESTTFSIPNATLGLALYPLVVGLARSGHGAAAIVLAAAAVAYGAYLGRVMVFRIRALCTTCLNLAALNLLILLQLLR